jgi:GAF domain
MPSEPLHATFDALRARLQAELETQLVSLEATIDDRHRQAVADAMRAGAAEVDQQWSARLDALRDDWAARLRDELATTTAASARALATEVGRLEAEKAAAIAAAESRRESGDRSRAVLARLTGALRTIAGASSLTHALDALADAAAAEVPSTSLFLVTRVNGADDHTLEPWRSTGFDGHDSAPPSGPLAEAIRTKQPVAAPDPSVELPGAQPGHVALVMPLVVGGETVAVLHARGDDAAAWPDAVRILAQHASACLAQLTAVRMQSLAAGWSAPRGTRDDDGSARRYARLLVSEIKLYNESAVRTGREQRDLLTRLRPEIDRARRLYEERIPVSMDDRATLFEQELVQTLAEGDPTLLGASA